MTNETDELRDIVKCLDEHISDLKQEIATLNERVAALNIENSEWLKIYQRHSVVISELTTKTARLESRLKALQERPDVTAGR